MYLFLAFLSGLGWGSYPWIMNKQNDTGQHLSLACLTFFFLLVLIKKNLKCNSPKWVDNLSPFPFNFCLGKWPLKWRKEGIAPTEAKLPTGSQALRQTFHSLKEGQRFILYLTICVCECWCFGCMHVCAVPTEPRWSHGAGVSGDGETRDVVS